MVFWKGRAEISRMNNSKHHCSSYWNLGAENYKGAGGRGFDFSNKKYDPRNRIFLT